MIIQVFSFYHFMNIVKLLFFINFYINRKNKKVCQRFLKILYINLINLISRNLWKNFIVKKYLK